MSRAVPVDKLAALAVELHEAAARFVARSRSGPSASNGGSADINAGRADGLERAALKLDALIGDAS